jgi:hypothetical protein
MPLVPRHEFLLGKVLLGLRRLALHGSSSVSGATMPLHPAFASFSPSIVSPLRGALSSPPRFTRGQGAAQRHPFVLSAPPSGAHARLFALPAHSTRRRCPAHAGPSDPGRDARSHTLARPEAQPRYGCGAGAAPSPDGSDGPEPPPLTARDGQLSPIWEICQFKFTVLENKYGARGVGR